MSQKIFSYITRATLAACLLHAVSHVAFSQSAAATTTPQSPAAASASKATTPASAETDAKAEAIVQRAVETLGGRAYLDVKNITSRGIFTPFQEGRATLPNTFVDYLVFPDRERAEFRGQSGRYIQTNDGERGWLFDAAARKILDLKPEQVADYRLTIRTGLDNLLRGWWRAGGGAKLAYVGRREAGIGRRNEVVRLTYADGLAVEFEFGAKDNLPAKVLYKKANKEGEETEEEDRYAQFLNINGVIVPFVIDHYRAGTQTSRVNYQTVEFNRSVPESLFARPADIKSIK